MFPKIKLATVAAAVGVLCHAPSASAQTFKRSFEKSAFSNFKSLPVNRTAGEQTRKNVHSIFAGWAVTTDKVSGAFTDIYGTPMQVAGGSTTEKAQSCISSQLGNFGIKTTEWKQSGTASSPKADFVNYKESLGGHPVVFSSLSFRFTKEGQLERIQAKNYGRPASKTQPTLSAGDAEQAALSDMNDVTITSKTVDANWSWFPVPSATGYELRPAWHFKINGRIPGSVPLKLDGYIDGITGALLYRTNLVKETGFDGTVKAVVYKSGTENPATLEPLQDLNVSMSATTLVTDSGGLFSTSLLSLPITATVPLAGLWSTVIDSVTGLNPSFTDALSITGSTYTYPTTAPSSGRHNNAYYHVTRVHNYMKTVLPTFTGMDFSLPTNVDLGTGNCNAFYSGTDINFFAADATCPSYAEIGDIVYHEYGHGISDHMYTELTGATIMNGALNEAMSDVWAMCIIHNPVLGINCYVGFGGFIRRYDITPQVYPIDLQGFDPHKDGQIIAGTWWDVAVNLGNVDSMAKLFTEVYYATPDGPNGTEGAVYQSILTDALMADDDDHNLMNGTPHYSQIVAAFAKHGIYLEGEVSLLGELADQLPNAPITVNALYYQEDATYFSDLTLYYRVNGAGSWNAIPMTGSSPSYSATIPAQPAGTVIEYRYVVHDALNIPNAFFPITCNPQIPFYQQTIPYQFIVGGRAVDTMNFDGSTAPGWVVSSSGGVSGGWHRGVPTPNMYFPPSWPAGDHTSGTGKCMVTGTGSGGGYMGNPVQNGTSIVTSPIFNVSGMTSPIVCYYRWFSNEQFFDNFKKDPWIVRIRNVSSTSWQTVEATYQADDNWRRKLVAVNTVLSSHPDSIQLKFFASDSVYSTWNNDGQTITVGGIDDFYIFDAYDRTGVSAITAGKAEIYPNPADEAVHVVLQAGTKGTIGIYNMEGKKLSETQMTVGTTEYSISTNHLPAGNYNLVIQSDAGIQSTKIAVLHN